MGESKHTPGPWAVEPGHSVVVIVGSDGRRIGAVDRASYYQSFTEQDLIDAHLIAAAPDLLEALKALRHKCSGPLLRQADAALAKARGEA